MPRLTPVSVFRTLLVTISRSHGGMSRDEIGYFVRRTGQVRTLQRQLSRLVTEQWLVTSGKGSATLYLLAPGRSIPPSWLPPSAARAAPANIAAAGSARPASLNGSPTSTGVAPHSVPSQAAPVNNPPPATAAQVPPVPTASAWRTARPSALPARSAATSQPTAAKVPSRAAAATPTVAPSSAASSTAPVPRVVAPMTPQEHAAYDEYLQGLIPPIVKTKMTRRNAWMYADRVAERFKPAERDRFHALLEAQLDTLSATACLEFSITAETYAAWRRNWERG